MTLKEFEKMKISKMDLVCLMPKKEVGAICLKNNTTVFVYNEKITSENYHCSEVELKEIESIVLIKKNFFREFPLNKKVIQSNSSEIIQNPELLTIEQAAEYLGISAKTLYKWRSNKKVLVPFIKYDKTVRYRKQELIKFIESRVVL